jgi:hypothetical protein
MHQRMPSQQRFVPLVRTFGVEEVLPHLARFPQNLLCLFDNLYNPPLEIPGISRSLEMQIYATTGPCDLVDSLDIATIATLPIEHQLVLSPLPILGNQSIIENMLHLHC